jgi:hypothetical protein
MIHKNFVVLDQNCLKLVKINVLISETRCIFTETMIQAINPTECTLLTVFKFTYLIKN